MQIMGVSDMLETVSYMLLTQASRLQSWLHALITIPRRPSTPKSYCQIFVAEADLKGLFCQTLPMAGGIEVKSCRQED